MDTFLIILSESISCPVKRLFSLHSSLLTNHSQISSLLESKDGRTDFITNFSRYVENLEHFLFFSKKEFSNPKKPPVAGIRHIANEILDLVISVLNNSEFELANTDSLGRLVIAALKYGLPYQSSSLKIIASKLAAKPGLLEHMVSSTDGAETASELFQVHFVNAVPWICSIWAQKLIGLCSACTRSPACHGIEFEVRKWHALTDVIEALEGYQSPNLPLGPIANHPSLSEQVFLTIKELQLKLLYATRRVDVLLRLIQDTEIPALVSRVLSTFPCHSCNMLAKDPRPTRSQQSDQDIYPDPPSAPVPDSFGAPIGLWKILLPEQAFKDIRRQELAGK
jgi:hypothetical protein